MSGKYDLQQLKREAKDLRIALRASVSDFQLLSYDKLYNLFMVEEEIARFEMESRADSDSGRVQVILTSVGPMTIDVIKALRSLDPTLSLKDAKGVVDSVKAGYEAIVIFSESPPVARKISADLAKIGASTRLDPAPDNPGTLS